MFLRQIKRQTDIKNEQTFISDLQKHPDSLQMKIFEFKKVFSPCLSKKRLIITSKKRQKKRKKERKKKEKQEKFFIHFFIYLFVLFLNDVVFSGF